VTKIPCCAGNDGVCWASAGSGNIRYMMMTLFTYHLNSVSNLHLILGNLLICSAWCGSVA